MLKIAVCEKNAVSAAKATAYLARYKAERNAEMEWKLYSGSEAFPEEVNDKIDAAFVALEKSDPSGLEKAHKLHGIEPNAAIVFVTDMAQFALHGYDTDVMDFLAKPVSYSAFSTMMDRVVRRAEEKNAPALYLDGKEGTMRVEIDDIYYLQTSKNSVVYHTKSGNVAVAGSLSEEKIRLPEGVFAKCNTKTIVHLGYVTKVMGNNVFVGGKTLSIARNRRTEFLAELLAYMDRR